MNLDALFTTWDIPWAVTTALAVTALVYIRGWNRIHRTRPAQLPVWRLLAFLSGILAIFTLRRSTLFRNLCCSCTWRSISCSCRSRRRSSCSARR
jgi:hypothetical protein